MGWVQDLRAKEAGLRMGSGSQTRKQAIGWVQALGDKEVGLRMGSGSQRQGSRE